ncbi:MAG: HAMP domain-containing histidine kinase [Firmicutes bacterium]|jgi:signal transduction histidine kinase|nr:HAMP domain-containing histidine kinase [Bacillota bacterium]
MNERLGGTERLGTAHAMAYGAALFGVFFLNPAFLNVRNLRILDLLWQALEGVDIVPLLDSCVRLVLMNTVRIVPTYLGSLVVADILVRAGVARRRATWMYFLIPVFTVPLTYVIIKRIYGITYDFAMPAVLSIAGVVGTLRISRASESRSKTAVIVTQFLFGFQWLDIVPALSALGFGRGEVSTAVKDAALIMGAESLLNLIGVLMSSVLVASALITAKFMVDYQAHIRLVEAERRKSAELARIRSEAVLARTYREMQTLVHDLRTPLTTIQGLASMMAQAPEGARGVREHAAKISQASDRMDSMIRQLLSSDARRWMPAREFISVLRAHLPEEKTRGAVSVVERNDLPWIEVNETRLARAMMNLIDNALDSSAERVVVRFDREGEDLSIIVEDDGPGMSEEALLHCWDPGYSTKNSTGLGLPFVKDIVAEHGGKIEITNGKSRGTLCKIIVPGMRGNGAKAQDSCGR